MPDESKATTSETVKQRMARLSPEKRKILERRLNEKLRGQSGGALSGNTGPIPRRESNDALPLSYAQERIWFLDQFEPGNPFYNVNNALRIRFPLNVEALERSYNEVIRRHESLRTTFSTMDGRPTQVVAPSLHLSMELRDLRHMPAADRLGEALRIAAEEGQRPFDLAHGPLLRASLVQMGAADYLLILGMHHIISDGWSMDVFAKEIASFYVTFCAGKAPAFPALAIQYADFALWQRQWLSGGVFERQMAYWKSQLANMPVLQLPTDRPRPGVMTYRGTRLPIRFPDALSEKVKALSRQEDVTLFMVFLAAFQTLLYRYTGQDDIVVGSPVANRNRVELEGLIGFFVNTLVLRGNLSGEPTFRDLLSRVRQTAVDAYANQDLPFERLVEELQPQRDLSRNPLFQVCFQVFNVRSISESMFEPCSVEAGTSQFDLRLDLLAGENGIKGFFEYSTDLFDSTTIIRFANHFLRLLESIANNPSQPISEISLLSPAERRQLLVEWNDTRSAYPQEPVHRIFEAQVARSPDAVAIASGNVRVTYRDLNHEANRLARELVSRGISAGKKVAVYLERSADLVIAQLGILKAGGAYLPLDLEYPPDRLSVILRDSDVGLVVTHSLFAKTLPVGQAQVLHLDRDIAGSGTEQNPRAINASADDVAYVMYTSGSTGKPKGITVPHRAISRLVCNTNYVSLGPSDRVAQASNASFDASTFEIWGALLNGSCLVVFPKEALLAPEELGALLKRERITTLFLTTDLFHPLAGQVPEIFQSLRTLLFGGSIANPQAVREVLRNGRSLRLIHCYGPTESTTFAAYHEVREVAEDAMTIPIGRPIANTQLYILDPKSQPVPIGVPGELHIGGDGLAHGYLNDSVLTAEKFIANPHAGSPGTRLYRTGDIARYRSDGAIEFIGRADRQVKIRGFRIELGEIEVHLRAHPQVIEAVVLAREDTPGDKRLAAYVVPRQQQPAESDFGQTYPTLLRAHLHERLPEYMVPASYVLMDSLPLTPNGKLDHRALPRPEAADRDIGNEFVAPRNAVEMKLAEIWQQVLDLERVGIHDNFFALGGDSILSIQIVARARQAGLEVTPKQFFQHQTIADLARVISFQTRVRAEQGPITGAAPLTPVQQWFFEQELQDPHHFNQAVLLLVPDLLDAAILRRAFEAVVTHHDALRVRFRQQAGAWEQFFATPDGKVQFSAHDLAGVPEAERSAAIERIAAAEEAGLDLMHGPVALTAFFDCGPGNSGRLLIVIHHLAVDAVSWRLLMEDFWTAYDQMSRGDAVRLPAKTTSFRDWSVHLSMRARTADIRKELPHWLTTVNDEAVRSLPRDFNGSTNLVESAQKVSVSLSEAQTAALLRQVPEAYKTQINDALLTALVEAFSLWTGERALLVDVEGHGREAISEEIDLSRTVGWFTSIYPVCLRLPREISIGGALKSIKEQLRRLPGRGMGYGLLRYLSLDPSIGQSLSALRQPEVSFNYLGQILAAGPASSIRLAEESCGPTRSLRQSRRYLLEINGRVFGGRLQLEWTFSEAIHRRATIETLARNFLSALISIIEHCQSPEAGGHTPSDFSQAKLSQAALDKLVARVKHSAESEE